MSWGYMFLKIDSETKGPAQNSPEESGHPLPWRKYPKISILREDVLMKFKGRQKLEPLNVTLS